jgi:small subunit ribosomal protein S9
LFLRNGGEKMDEEIIKEEKKGEILFWGTGRRKRAVARVRLYPGSGKIMVNGKRLDEYFPRRTLQELIKQPLIKTATLDKFDIEARVNGGGLGGQAGAFSHGIARALVESNSELHPILQKSGLLTRDPRMHERKKYGQPGRRKKFQYSKR